MNSERLGSNARSSGASRERWRAAWYLLLAVLILLGVWQALALLIHSLALPGPLPALRALSKSLGEGLLLHVWISTLRVVAAMVLSVVVAVPIGLYLGRQEQTDLVPRRRNWLARWTPRVLPPLIYLTYPIPKVVFLPIIMMLLGIGDVAKAFFIAMVVGFQILVTARDAAKGVNRGSVLSVQSLGGGEWDLFRHVVWPAALPEIFTSLRNGLGTAIAVLFLSETFATNSGVGYFLVDAWARIAYDEMFAAVIAMGFMGLILYLLLDWMERLACPWRRV
ncbi:MAG: ABC transporter permease [Symbiobacteriia bacterium]